MTNITLCSASFNSGHYLKLNYEVISNYSKFDEWIVALSPQKGIKEPNHSRIIHDMDGIRLINPKLGKCKSKNVPAWYQCELLNSAVFEAKTRYIVVLDPDCYIFHSLNDIVDTMKENNYSFFGTPFRKNKAPAYPIQAFMVIDTSLFPKSKIDFSIIDNDGSGLRSGEKIYRQYDDYNWYCTSLCTDYCEICSKKNHRLCHGGKVDRFFLLDDRFFGIHVRMHVDDPKKGPNRMKPESIEKIFKWVQKNNDLTIKHHSFNNPGKIYKKI